MAKPQLAAQYGKPRSGDTGIAYQVEIFEEEDPALLRANINGFLLLNLPALNNNAFVIQDIKYSSAQKSNNTVSYSALISFITFG